MSSRSQATFRCPVYKTIFLSSGNVRLKARARAHLAALPREDGTFDPLAAPLVADEDVEMELLRRQREMKGDA